MVAFNIGEEKSYAWVITKNGGFWTEISTNSKLLNAEVQLLRQSLTFEVEKPFDADLSYKIYNELFKPI